MKTITSLSSQEQRLIKFLFGKNTVWEGAYNIRLNGELVGRMDSDAVRIEPKPNGAGIEVRVKPGVRGAQVHVPVLLSRSGLQDNVVNDFYIGKGSEVEILAGCGIHNDGAEWSQHQGEHNFWVEEGAKVKYVENHYGNGSGTEQIGINTTMKVQLGKGSLMEIMTAQLKGVGRAERVTYCEVGTGAKLVANERVMTNGRQVAKTEMTVDLRGKGSRAQVWSQAVAKGQSIQEFRAIMNGTNDCAGHVECDGILMGKAVIRAIPEVAVSHPLASLTHEAAIGRIASEQIDKLMTLGLTRRMAEQKIIEGFLR